MSVVMWLRCVFSVVFWCFCGEGWNNFEMAGQVFIDRFVEFCNLFLEGCW